MAEHILTPRTRRSAALVVAHPPPGRYLALEDGPETVLVPLRADLTRVGRSMTADIALEDGAVSRRHAIFVSNPGAPVEVVDQGSRNGILVNGECAKRRVLHHGDVVTIGRTEMRFLELTPGSLDGDTDALPLADSRGELPAAA